MLQTSHSVGGRQFLRILLCGISDGGADAAYVALVMSCGISDAVLSWHL